MSLTIAKIAAKALGASRKAITDSVMDATLTQITKGAYDAISGAHAEIRTTQTGQVVFQGSAPVADLFPDYVIGPNDRLLMLEGFADVRESDLITVGNKTRIVRAVLDISGAGTLFNVIAR